MGWKRRVCTVLAAVVKEVCNRGLTRGIEVPKMSRIAGSPDRRIAGSPDRFTCVFSTELLSPASLPA